MRTTWAVLFDRADALDRTPTVDAIRTTLSTHRERTAADRSTPPGTDRDRSHEEREHSRESVHDGERSRETIDEGASAGETIDEGASAGETIDEGASAGEAIDEGASAGETIDDGMDAVSGGGSTVTGQDDVSPARVVADADVLAADLLIGGASRRALDHVREHSWVDLVASDRLLAETTAVIETHADGGLAADWRERIDRERVAVDHPPGDHPALASAYRAGAAHLLSYEESLASARTGLSIQPHVKLSVRPPDAFATLFDPGSLYEAVVGGAYPGPDRDPRA